MNGKIKFNLDKLAVLGWQCKDVAPLFLFEYYPQTRQKEIEYKIQF